MPVLLLLTHVDKVCEPVKTDKRLMFHSRTVHKLVNTAATRYGLTPYCILPLVNYTEEQVVNPAMNILVLRAVLKILQVASNVSMTQ